MEIELPEKMQDRQIRALSTLCNDLDKRCMELLSELTAAKEMSERQSKARDETEEEWQVERDGLNKALASLRGQLATATAERDALRAELSAPKRNASNAELSDVTGARSAALEADLAAMKGERSALQDELAVVTAQASAMRDELTFVTAHRGALQAELLQLRSSPTPPAPEIETTLNAVLSFGASKAFAAALLLPPDELVAQGVAYTPTDPRISLAQYGLGGTVEAILANETGAIYRGWLASPANDLATPLLLVVDEDGISGIGRPTMLRPDVIADYPECKSEAGFSIESTRAPKGQSWVIATSEAILKGVRFVKLLEAPPELQTAADAPGSPKRRSQGADAEAPRGRPSGRRPGA